ncbi:putative WD-repeat protein, partial [Mycena vulgaris]
PHAVEAVFNSKDREPCLSSTRTEILAEISSWINVNNSKTDPADAEHAEPNRRIFWLNGSAGTGKTTIAYTVAQSCNDREPSILGASFFCSRDDANCSNLALIFTTIAYQLALFNPVFAAEVSKVLRAKPDIGYASASYQLEELIVKPLRVCRDSFMGCVIILDALDECKDPATISTILSALSRHIQDLVPFLFLVTSRPENHISIAFKSDHLQPNTQKFILHQVKLEVVEQDIRHYLSMKLLETRRNYGIQDPWPVEESIDLLARLSSGLFIFAATSIKYIEDRSYSNPRGQLQHLIGPADTSLEGSSPLKRLDDLYTDVLTRAFPNISVSFLGLLKMVLGSIVHLQDPLPSVALETLLGLGPGRVRETLLHLHALLIVPEEENHVIRLLHPSFADFITNPKRCTIPNYVVKLEEQHTLLAQSCLLAMQGLSRDICQIRNTSLLNSEIRDLPARIQKHVPAHVQYACRHWAHHVSKCMISSTLLALLQTFCEQHLLHWMEISSLLGELRNVLVSASDVRPASTTIELLSDCERFACEFFTVISTCALQIYHSALLFTPKDTKIRKVYSGQMDLPLHILNAVGNTWHPCMRIMDGHSAWVKSVAFSPDGMYIVSGSYDYTVRLWDAASGAHLGTLKGHSGGVNSVAFSPDGTHIVSGSDDNTVRLWDAASGAHMGTLKGHSRRVRSVAFSPDGMHIASGSDDSTVRLWDAASRAHLGTLKGHSDYVNSVAFSPDGMHIASGSNDSTVRLWDAASGAHLGTLKGHSDYVNSVAFSPDGMHIASGSDDFTVRLWDAVSRAHLGTLKGDSDYVKSVAFSPDGMHIASGSDDSTVRLWDAASRAHLGTLKGHSDYVNSVAFSPDGMHIASGSDDSTVRLWDAASGAHLRTLEGHSRPVNSVAFSPDGMHIVSGSHDFTVRLWDAASGAHLGTLKGHSDRVRSVAFSPDGMHIASGSDDSTVRLWDAASRAHLGTLKGHSDYVNSVAFSPDGMHIASGSDDKTVRLWDAVSGAHLRTLKGHSSSVRSVALSPDGTHIVSGSDDKTVRLWDAVSGAQLHMLEDHSGSVRSVGFSLNGVYIISRAAGNTACVWETATGVCLETPAVHLLESSQHNSSKRPQSSVWSDEWIYSLTESGWIHSLLHNQRICWIPVEFRNGCFSSFAHGVVLGLPDGRVVILDFTGMDSYYQTGRQ